MVHPLAKHPSVELHTASAICRQTSWSASTKSQLHTLAVCSSTDGCLASGCTMLSPASAHFPTLPVQPPLGLPTSGWTPLGRKVLLHLKKCRSTSIRLQNCPRRSIQTSN